MEIGNSNEIKDVHQDLKLIFNISEYSFEYTIFNTIQNRFEKITSYKIDTDQNILAAEIENIIDIDPYLKKKYSKTLGALKTKFSTFIPEVLFDDTSINNYIDNTHGTIDEEYKYVKQKFINCFEVFTVDPNLLSLLQTNFKNLDLKSSSSIFVDYAINLNLQKTRKILVQVNKDHFHIVLISDGIFKFHNLFHFKNTNDFIYHIMNCIQTLEIKPNNLELYITSELEKTHVLFEKLKKYININFMDRPSIFLYQDRIMQTSTHKHHNLFSQLICE